MDIDKIIDKCDAKTKKICQEVKTNCQELTKKLEYLVQHPRDGSFAIDDINNEFNFRIFSSGSHYHTLCDEFIEFQRRQNAPSSRIKIETSKKDVVYNHVLTIPNIYDRTVKYVLFSSP